MTTIRERAQIYAEKCAKDDDESFDTELCKEDYMAGFRAALEAVRKALRDAPKHFLDAQGEDLAISEQGVLNIIEELSE